MAELGQTLSQPGLVPVLDLGRAELPPLCSLLPSVLGANLPSSAGRCAAWRVARALFLHRPGSVTSASSLLLPGFWALNTGIARADFWAPAFSFFDLILAA